MYRNLLGMSAGLALGASLFAAPASAATVTWAEVGSVDDFLGACSVADPTLPGTGLEEEINCINRETGLTFLNSDATKMESLDFMLVDGETDVWAQLLEINGGWFSIKTGMINCDDLIAGDDCIDGTQHYLIFENLPNSWYAVVDLADLLSTYGFDIDNIDKFSHITIVPLPATALLFGSALFGGGLLRRRKMINKDC